VAVPQRSRHAEPDGRHLRALQARPMPAASVTVQAPRLVTCMVREHMRRSVRIAKRAVDMIGAAIGLAVSAPLVPIIAIAIYLDSPGPIFFRQRRAGRLKRISN